MHLDRLINNSQGNVGHDHFDLRDFAFGSLGPHLVDHPRCFESEQARLLDQDPRVGDHIRVSSQLDQRPAKSHSRQRSPAKKFQGAFRRPQGSHAVMNAPWPEAALRNLKSTSRSGDDVIHRDAHVAEAHLSVAERSVIAAKNRHHTHDLNSGSGQRHQHH